jgi:voltage-gated potassium channel
MGKVTVPSDKDFLRKILLALLILISMVIMADIALMMLGYESAVSFPKAIGIVTHVDIMSEQIGLKYFFALLSIMGNVVQFYLIYIFLEYMLDGKFRDLFRGVRHMNKARKMKDHYIVAGGGRVGSHAAKILKNYTDNVVIIDKNEDVVDRLVREGFISVKGDVLDENFLKEMNIDKAKYIIACLGEDSDNILLALTARELHPGIKISARANSENAIGKLSHAGATHVVVPSSIGGEELAKNAARIS